MPELSGDPLQIAGKEIFTNIGLECCTMLNQSQLLDIHPTGSFSSNEHLEIDYLIPYKSYCLVGEITSRSNRQDVSKKYQKFRNHFNLLSEHISPNLWNILGVPPAVQRDFRDVTKLKGFFISTSLQRFDVNFFNVANILPIFKTDWELLKAYSESIGNFAREHFLSKFGVIDTSWHQSIDLHETNHIFIVTNNKKIASNVGLADIFTFEVSPYDILPVTQVFRRDLLPTLTSSITMDYQRPLLLDKLRTIRENLLSDEDFIFPSSILVVLSQACSYSPTEKALRIPLKYGSISVIDGQHRLFSYASEEVRNRLQDRNRIMVTAIKFHETDEKIVYRYSAKTFIEINTNQTPVPRTHLDAIAYDLLDEKSPRAIAAKILLELNERKGSKLYGLFDTNKTGLGIIKVTTVLMSLKSITNLDLINRVQNARVANMENLRRGYENLFGNDDTSISISDLVNTDVFIDRGVSCLERYFNHVGSIFTLDWPKRGKENISSLKFAKMISGFVKLLWKDFIYNGVTWDEVQNELEKIRDNVLEVRNMKLYDEIIFDPSNQHIPNAIHRDYEHYRFLSENRQKPTSIQDVISRGN